VKLLFDQNISYKVAKRLKVSYPDCAQIRELGLENRSDREIWEFSKNEGFTIVSFDSDFYDLVTLYGHPPKIIWLRTGNTRTENIISIFQENYEKIKMFLNDGKYEDFSCLEIT
jgi:predicted nuclease of predicted toxin-antitoxin system